MMFHDTGPDATLGKVDTQGGTKLFRCVHRSKQKKGRQLSGSTPRMDLRPAPEPRAELFSIGFHTVRLTDRS